jgi:hypothetical protein
VSFASSVVFRFIVPDNSMNKSVQVCATAIGGSWPEPVQVGTSVHVIRAGMVEVRPVMVLEEIRPRLSRKSIPEGLPPGHPDPGVARSTRTSRGAAALDSRPNSDPARRNQTAPPGRCRSGRSLFGLLTVVRYQATPDKFLVSPSRLNHRLSITVASPDVICYEFFRSRALMY